LQLSAYGLVRDGLPFGHHHRLRGSLVRDEGARCNAHLEPRRLVNRGAVMAD
jgi:hypothetical protein